MNPEEKDGWEYYFDFSGVSKILLIKMPSSLPESTPNRRHTANASKTETATNDHA